MSMPEKVTVCEVCPRDGWQNHPISIPTDMKIHYIKEMVKCGAGKMEITSFVNPKYVPQMSDAGEVFAGVRQFLKENNVVSYALALNRRGVEDAREAGFEHVEFVLSASEEHNLRNSRRTIRESLEIFKNLAKEADDLHIILAMPCIFGSPFGDEVPLDRVKWLIDEAESVGVEEFGIADTAGISNPENTRNILREIRKYTDMSKVSLHMHDTYGMGLANVYVALEEGITMVDASLGGMGGCPFVPGAKGNIAMEDLIYMLHHIGIKTDYDLERLNLTAKQMGADISANITSCQSAVCRMAS
ncbi:MAG: hydroxymethylglutaryl-CoA lyase [Lachnospiraceae bacterium]|nr:hydroxymethylglutaryl-CoA lyase [Lachnospiraceae bacterium]